jgi:hypothetical protein
VSRPKHGQPNQRGKQAYDVLQRYMGIAGTSKTAFG